MSERRVWRKGPRRTGLVFVLLAILTVLEFLIGAHYRHSLLLILPIALVMSYLLLTSVMRIDDLRGRDER